MTGVSDMLNCLLCCMHGNALESTVQSPNGCLKHNEVNLMDLKTLYTVSKLKYI